MQTLMRCAASGVALCVSLAAGAPADDASLDDIVIVATRSPTPLSHIGNSVTVIDAPAIQESQASAVADLLAQTPGVVFARNGGVGQLTSVFIRGAGSDETVVLIDGVQITDAWSTAGGYFFDDLLSAGIGRIEILRGAQSTLYGSQAMGGVINIISAEPDGPFGGRFAAEAGSHNTGYLSANIGGKGDALLWQVSADGYGSSGYPAFDRDHGGTRADASQIAGGNARIRYDFTPTVQFDARAYYSQGRVDTDGFDTPSGSFGDDNEYSKKSHFVGYAGLNVATADRSLVNRLAIHYANSEQREYDPGPRYAAAFYANADLETFYGIGHTTREEYQGTWHIGAGWHAVFGVQHEANTIRTDTPAFDYSPAVLENDTTTNSAYAQLQGEITEGLTLTAGERYDRHSQFGGHSTGQFAAAWAIPGSQTILRASFGQGFKAPSLYQLFSANGVGNAALRPEAATSWDASIEQRALDGHLQLAATYFHRDSHDLIDFFECPVFMGGSPQCVAAVFGGYYANIDEATAHGVELAATYRPDDALTLSANYTLTATENRSPGSADYGDELVRRPHDAANASLSYCWSSRLAATIAGRYVGRTFDDVANQHPLGGYVLTDLRLSWQQSDRLEVYGRINNVAGKHYEMAYQYGTPGREMFVGMRAGF
jgi:vitamin B12 transporter